MTSSGASGFSSPSLEGGFDEFRATGPAGPQLDTPVSAHLATSAPAKCRS